MNKVIKKGKVHTYTPANGKVVCTGSPPTFFWIGGRVRIGGTRKSRCNITTKTFDVTISAATAALLVPNFEFDVEYDNDDPGSIKTVTMFAGEVIPVPPAVASLGGAVPG
jgi:hypothetical protein